MGKPSSAVQHRRRFLWSLLLLLAPLIFAPVAASATAKRVLLLEQDDLSRSFYAAQTIVLRNELRRQLPDVDLYSESLGFWRFPVPKYRSLTLDWLAEKYRDRKIDLIVSVGSSPFATALRDRISPNAPVVFCAITLAEMGHADIPKNTTGLANRLRLRDTLELVQRLALAPRGITIIGNFTSRLALTNDEKQSWVLSEQKLNVMNLINLEPQELDRRVQELPPGNVILYLGSGSGRHIEGWIAPNDPLSRILKHANVPVLVPATTVFGTGALGGYMIAPEAGTEIVADMARRLLQGEPISRMPIVEHDSSKPIFDDRQLKRWRIDARKLPPGSEIRYRQPGAWEQYAWQIVVALSVALLEALLIVMLLRERKRRREAEMCAISGLADLAHLDRVAALGELSASIAHELNQPLGAMLSNSEAAEILLDAPKFSPDKLREALTAIRQDSQRAAGIIRSMRALFRKSGVESLPVNINKIVDEVGALMTWVVQSEDHKIAFDLAPDLPEVIGDRTQLQQVVFNLVVNALEAINGSKSNQPGTVTVRTGMDCDGRVEVSVTDNGPGIPKQDLEKIFEPYITSKPQGMGMGLAVARAIIEAHGSKLYVRNLTIGVRFWFALKVCDQTVLS